MTKRIGIFNNSLKDMNTLFKKKVPNVESPHIILIQGKTGTYKTSIASALATKYLRSDEGKSTTGLYVTLEQSAEQIKKTMADRGIKFPANLIVEDLGVGREAPAAKQRHAKKILRTLKNERPYVTKREQVVIDIIEDLKLTGTADPKDIRDYFTQELKRPINDPHKISELRDHVIMNLVPLKTDSVDKATAGDPRLLALRKLLDDYVPRTVIERVINIEELPYYPEALKARNEAREQSGGLTPGRRERVVRPQLRETFPWALVDYLLPTEEEELKEKDELVVEFYVDHILGIISEMVEKKDLSVVIIDSLPLLIHYLETEGTENMRDELFFLFNNLRKHSGVYSFIIAELNRSGDYPDKAHESAAYVSDGVIEVGKKRDLGKGKGRYISIEKMRGARHTEEPHELLIEPDEDDPIQVSGPVL